MSNKLGLLSQYQTFCRDFQMCVMTQIWFDSLLQVFLGPHVTDVSFGRLSCSFNEEKSFFDFLSLVDSESYSIYSPFKSSLFSFCFLFCVPKMFPRPLEISKPPIASSVATTGIFAIIWVSLSVGALCRNIAYNGDMCGKL